MGYSMRRNRQDIYLFPGLMPNVRISKRERPSLPDMAAEALFTYERTLTTRPTISM